MSSEAASPGVRGATGRCDRCGGTAYIDRGEVQCLACGPRELPLVSLEEARREVEGPLEGRLRKRGPYLYGGVGTRYGDGCDVARRCLECPLPECKFVASQAGAGLEPTDPVRWVAWRVALGEPVSAERVAGRFSLSEWEAAKVMAADWPAFIAEFGGEGA